MLVLDHVWVAYDLDPDIGWWLPDENDLARIVRADRLIECGFGKAELGEAGDVKGSIQGITSPVTRLGPLVEF